MLKLLSKQQRIRLLSISSCIILIGAFLSSTYPIISVIKANASVNQLNIDGLDTITAKRKVQTYYLDYGIYIPIDDIIVEGESSIHDSLNQNLEKLCGRGKIYIWTPLKLRIPLFGERFIEWCQNIG